MSEPIELRCPTCSAQPGERCRTRATGRVTDFHVSRPNSVGFTGRDEQGRQWCLGCQRWKFPAVHSCPGVPQRAPDGYDICPKCGHHTSAAVAGRCTVIMPATLRYCGCDCYKAIHGESLSDVISRALRG